MQLKLDLAGRTALVCGASQGIGRAAASLLAGHGASVIALARDAGKLEALVRELPRTGQARHSFLAVDIGDRGSLENQVRSQVKDRGSIDILICNTGGPKGGPIAEASDEQFVQAFENHVLVNSLLAKLVLPTMKINKFGRIINVISTSVKVPIVNLGVSNTIRAAVASWAKTLSLEVAPLGITVNNVLPGYTNTPRLHSLIEAAATKSGRSREDVADEWRRSVPMNRFAEPEEIAAAIVFFASPAAQFITGTSLACDGGRTGAL